MKQAQLRLNVPFAAKDQAKALGARWDPQQRSWYVPPGVDIQPFQAWWPEDLRAQASAAMEQLKPAGMPQARLPAARKPPAGRAATASSAIFTGPAEVAADDSDKLPWED